MKREDKLQVFDNEYKGRCETFSCDGTANIFVGRPDAIHLAVGYCDTCVLELVESIQEQYLAADENEPILDSDFVAFLVNNKIKSEEDFKQVLAASVKTNSEITSTEEAMEALMMEPDNNDTVTLLLTDQEETEGVDLDEVLEAARTHAEVDTVVKEFGFEGIPTKNDGATLAERKTSIVAAFDALEAE